jgi:hypothetical protein
MKKLAVGVLLTVSVLFSACSQTQVSPTEQNCSVCEEPAPVVPAPIVNQCPKQVSVIKYTDGCNTCKGTYAVTVRKNSCCSAQGCDK